MDDVSLKQQQQQNASASAQADRDLDNLIFNDKKDETLDQRDSLEGKPQGSDDGAEDSKKASDRSSLGNVLPVDRLKNGATTASKYDTQCIVIVVVVC